MQKVKAPLPAVAAAIAVVMEFFVGMAIIVGVLTRPLALAFAAFTLDTALVGRRFWAMDGEMRHENNFLKNMSIVGRYAPSRRYGPGPLCYMALVAVARRPAAQI